ncbi:zinc-binding protein A33 isoform X1 [Amia ocellicauda]|uniref:zinc-binding protein A33 isoform X1 n=1 Tax=Amia ocellicauda TaxID=2972642 RepID=UPI00346447B3
MAARAVLEDELCCPVCCDVFMDPVVLRCSHSFCKACLDQCWSQNISQQCPLCRRRSSTDKPPSNLTLRNIVESWLKQKGDKPPERTSDLCRLHTEKLKLYCLDDQEAICVVCQTSKKHKLHNCCPVEEATQEFKDELKTALKPMQEKLESFNTCKKVCEKTAGEIKIQAQQTERKIKKEFEELHQFLRDEEAARLAVLREEEELKSLIMEEKIQNLSRRISSLSNTIKAIEKEMRAGDMSFLLNYKSLKTRAQCTQPDPEGVSGVLIDVAKHLSSLKYRVWEKMLGLVQYTPVTLDPNTAAPWLSLSEDLTSVSHTEKKQDLPDNPERCAVCVCVLGSEGFTAGRHCWEVEVGNKTKWDVGVLKESINRKGIINVSPEEGFWAVALRNGHEYSACTTAWTRLWLKRKPQRVRVELDYDRGEVAFFDPTDMTPIYTFRDTFSERLFPYFSPCVNEDGRNPGALRICPGKVSIQIG